MWLAKVSHGALGSSEPNRALTPGELPDSSIWNSTWALPPGELPDSSIWNSTVNLVGAPNKPNVLFLMADDMRPNIKAYGNSFMRTPNLDASAQGSLLFEQAYSQFAYCAPSRASFMTGRRPDRTKVVNFAETFRNHHGNWITMAQHFKMHGYFTTAAGKIFHDGMDDPASWSGGSKQVKWKGCQPGDFMDSRRNYCGARSANEPTDDAIITHEGLASMDAAHHSGRPWFVAVGLHRPHAPFRVPLGWWGTQLYPGKLDPPKYPHAVAKSPYMAGFYQKEAINDENIGCPTCVVPASRTIEYRRWYYAAW